MAQHLCHEHGPRLALRCVAPRAGTLHGMTHMHARMHMHMHMTCTCTCTCAVRAWLFNAWPHAQAPPPSPPPAQPPTPAQPPLPPSTPLANFVAAEPDIEDFVSWMRAASPFHIPSHPVTHFTYSYPRTRLCTHPHPFTRPLPGAPRRWPRCASRCCASSRTCRPVSTR